MMYDGELTPCWWVWFVSLSCILNIPTCELLQWSLPDSRDLLPFVSIHPHSRRTEVDVHSFFHQSLLMVGGHIQDIHSLPINTVSMFCHCWSLESGVLASREDSCLQCSFSLSNVVVATVTADHSNLVFRWDWVFLFGQEESELSWRQCGCHTLWDFFWSSHWFLWCRVWQLLILVLLHLC